MQKSIYLISPKSSNIFLYKLEQNNQYSEVKVYDMKDKIEVEIFDNLLIDLNSIFQTNSYY